MQIDNNLLFKFDIIHSLVSSTTEVPRDSSCTVLKNVQTSILTSRQTKSNVAAFLLNGEDEDDNEENEIGIRTDFKKDLEKLK